MSRNSLIFFGLFALLSASNVQGQAEIDSLIHQLKYANRDTNDLKLLLNISNKYLIKGDFVHANPFCVQGLDLAKTLKASHEEARTSQNLAACQEYFGDYSNSLKNYLNAIKYWEDKGEYEKVASLYSRIESFYEGGYDRSLDFYNLVLKKIELSGDNEKIAYIFWIISGIYKEQCKKALAKNDTINLNILYKKNIDFNLKALKLAEQEKDTNGMCFYTNSLGYSYDALNFCNESNVLSQSQIFYNLYPEESLKYYNRSLKLSEIIGSEPFIIDSKSGIASFYKNEGNLFLQKGDLTKAKENFNKALLNLLWCLETIQKKGYEHGIANYNKKVGEVYFSLGLFSKSEKHLLKAVQFFKKRRYREGLKDCYKLLSSIYEKKNESSDALEYLKMFVSIKDSMTNEEVIKDRNKLTAKYESDTKDKKIELSNLKIERQSVQIIAIVIISFLVICIFALIIFLLRNKRKREKSESNQKILEVRQEALNAQMSSHFISNTMNSINNFMENNDKANASKYLLLFDRVIRKVIGNSSQKFVPLEIDLEVLTGYFDLEKLRFKPDKLLLDMNIDEGVDLDNILIPPMILQTLVENSIKHGFRKTDGGIIKVSIRKTLNQILCVVEDNGIGRSASMTLNKEENDEHQSFGSRLAERLVTFSGGMEGNTSFCVVDLYDEEGKPSGTKTEVKFPIITY